uniref:Uncharacterized protein n=1 Tax=Myoviridae sp. ctIty1 TaxID=2827673 RepID=A0A8S5TI33_9CAUD|nr:MAG TPA: hypothetical protein [Myoviridae sp. ctIty1]
MGGRFVCTMREIYIKTIRSILYTVHILRLIILYLIVSSN